MHKTTSKDEVFLSISEEDIVKKVEISNFS